MTLAQDPVHHLYLILSLCKQAIELYFIGERAKRARHYQGCIQIRADAVHIYKFIT